jgi:hypothetical protein
LSLPRPSLPGSFFPFSRKAVVLFLLGTLLAGLAALHPFEPAAVATLHSKNCIAHNTRLCPEADIALPEAPAAEARFSGPKLWIVAPSTVDPCLAVPFDNGRHNRPPPLAA